MPGFKLERENLTSLQKKAIEIGFSKSEEVDLGIGARLELEGGSLFLDSEGDLYIVGNIGDPGSYGFTVRIKDIKQLEDIVSLLK